MDKKNLVDADLLASKIENIASYFYIPTTTSYYNSSLDNTQQAMSGFVTALETKINNQITSQIQQLLRNIANEIRVSTKTVNECMLCHKQDWEQTPPKT